MDNAPPHWWLPRTTYPEREENQKFRVKIAENWLAPDESEMSHSPALTAFSPHQQIVP